MNERKRKMENSAESGDQSDPEFKRKLAEVLDIFFPPEDEELPLTIKEEVVDEWDSGDRIQEKQDTFKKKEYPEVVRDGYEYLLINNNHYQKMGGLERLKLLYSDDSDFEDLEKEAERMESGREERLEKLESRIREQETAGITAPNRGNPRDKSTFFIYNYSGTKQVIPSTKSIAHCLGLLGVQMEPCVVASLLTPAQKLPERTYVQGVFTVEFEAKGLLMNTLNEIMRNPNYATETRKRNELNFGSKIPNYMFLLEHGSKTRLGLFGLLFQTMLSMRASKVYENRIFSLTPDTLILEYGTRIEHLGLVQLLHPAHLETVKTAYNNLIRKGKKTVNFLLFREGIQKSSFK